MEFIASYNAEEEVGTIYCQEQERQILFANTVDGWEPIASFHDGEMVGPLPVCFSPDPALLTALDAAKGTGKSVTALL